jgi:hypothetical protein
MHHIAAVVAVQKDCAVHDKDSIACTFKERPELCLALLKRLFCLSFLPDEFL